MSSTYLKLICLLSAMGLVAVYAGYDECVTQANAGNLAMLMIKTTCYEISMPPYSPDTMITSTEAFAKCKAKGGRLAILDSGDVWPIMRQRLQAVLLATFPGAPAGTPCPAYIALISDTQTGIPYWSNSMTERTTASLFDQDDNRAGQLLCYDTSSVKNPYPPFTWYIQNNDTNCSGETPFPYICQYLQPRNSSTFAIAPGCAKPSSSSFQSESGLTSQQCALKCNNDFLCASFEMIGKNCKLYIFSSRNTAKFDPAGTGCMHYDKVKLT